MTRHQNTGLETFLSLDWYEMVLRFLFTFVAKTSEVLLAAGLVVSTANFLTDGSILAIHPAVSIAWAWAQAIAIDSSLGVSLSSAIQYLKQDEWMRGVLYALLTLLLAVVAGAITTIDIVSHALHLSTGDAMMQMGINIAVLSRLRAIAVIGFILMGRLRDLPLAALFSSAETESSPAPISGQSQESRVQTMIQSLCSQCSTEEMAQILNACIAAKKIVLAQVTPKSIPEPHQLRADQQRQSHRPEMAFDPVGSRAAQGEPAAPPLQSEPAPVSSREPARKVPMVTEPSGPEEHHLWRDPGPSSQVLYVPEPIASVPSKEPVPLPAPAREPQDGAVAPLELEAAPSLERLEQAYQSLLAEGKKPSGRALAERAHVHRSTCVEWLRIKQQLGPEELLLEEPERDGISMPDEPSSATVMDVPGKVPERKITSEPAEPSETALIDLPEREMDRHEVASNVSPDVFPDFSLPEDTPDA